jgi:GDP-4-dehydro-6-deoxy-D-mannose reductase
MKKVLITGVTGFAGSHLAETLVQENKWDVIGIHASDKNLANINDIRDAIHLEKVNLLDAEHTSHIVKETRPEIIFHLAAAATVKDSFENAADFINNNSASQINIFEAVRKNELLDTKIVVVSSANIYGIVSSSDIPINESVAFNPDNPYSVSKITQDYLGLCYYLAYKLPIIRLRPFNHVGSRMSSELSVSHFAKQIAEIEKGLKEPLITVGNLDAKRDFTDVRDIARAYILAAEHCTPGEAYNIGTGTSHVIGDVLTQLIGMSNQQIEVKSDESLFRPSDIPELRADASKFKQATGWEVSISFEKTLEDLLAYWRNIV